MLYLISDSLLLEILKSTGVSEKSIKEIKSKISKNGIPGDSSKALMVFVDCKVQIYKAEDEA
jgi:hypothetical protein